VIESHRQPSGPLRNNGKFALDPFRTRLDKEGIAICKAPSWEERENNGLLEKEPFAFSSCLGFRGMASRAFTHYADLWTAYTGSGGTILQGGVKSIGKMVPPKWAGWCLAIRVPRTQTALFGIPFPVFLYFRLATFVSLTVPKGAPLSYTGSVFDRRAGSQIDKMVEAANREQFQIFCQGYATRSRARELVFSNASRQRVTSTKRVCRSLVGLFWEGPNPTVADYNELRDFESKVGATVAKNLEKIRKDEARERESQAVLDDGLHGATYPAKINYLPRSRREANGTRQTVLAL
jgi:hypothetical protein